MGSIHHLSCGSGLFLSKVPLINYCLLVETNHGLLLVDTGFGRRDYTHPSRLVRVFAWVMGVSRNWAFHAADEAMVAWYGLRGIRVVPGLSLDVLLVPLPGHTTGHCGLAVETETGWLFHCGDAAVPFHPATDVHDRPAAEHLLGWEPAWLARRLVGPQVPRLRALVREHAEVQVISGHDVYSLRRLQGDMR